MKLTPNFQYNVKDEPWNADGGNNVVNYSETNRDNPTSNNKDQFTPKTGYDGQVAVGVSWDLEEVVEEGFTGRITRTPKQRNTIVFHELSENYYRTTKKLPYEYYEHDEFGSVRTVGIMEKVVDFTKKGAHQMAVDNEAKFWQKSTNPGVGSPIRSRNSTPEICPAYN